ncbi:hypothetical protein T06_13819 [Trichinella sp. T6]|nr:hypothetical protein T06_13819 [Trichinella sp. T6]
MFKFPMYYDRRCTKFRGHLYPTKRYTTVDIKRRWNQIPTNLNKEIRGIRWEKQALYQILRPFIPQLVNCLR